MPRIKAIVTALVLVCSGMLMTVPAAAGDFEPLSTDNPRVVLAELFTDASDDECPEAHQAMQMIEQEYARNEVIVLAWHANDQLSFTEGTKRIGWVNPTDYPTAVFDGITANVGGGTSADDVYIRYTSHVDQRLEIQSPLKMTVEWVYDTQTAEGDVWVNITALEDIRLPSMMLHTVVFENDVGPYDGGNGETMHDFVAREFLEAGGAAGADLTISMGETKRFTYALDASSYAEDADEIGVMAFVQSHGSYKEVLQAAYVGVPAQPNQPPVLSDAELNMPSGNTEDDEMTFRVLYKDTDDIRNKGPVSAKVTYKNATSGEIEADLEPESETGNWYDGRYMVYTTKLAPGDYTYRFSANDGKDDAVGDTGWSSPPVTILPRNSPPELKGATHSPGSGDTTTTFKFEVRYRDPDGTEPTSAMIYINDNDHDMTTTSVGPWDNWVYFYFETTLSVGDDHQVYYVFSDGTDETRYPTENAVPNWIVGPSVSAPNDVPTLSEPHHTPSDGYRSTEFEFTVTYTDGENDAPKMTRIYINDHPYFMTADLYNYDEGVAFTYKGKLGLGDHDYYFTFSDGTNDVRLPVTGTLEGPTVVNRDPVASIQYPTDGDEFEPGESISFSAVHSWDPDGDTLRYEWTSDIDGGLGSDAIFENTLTAEHHLITLTVSDDFGGENTASITIDVKEEYGHPYFIDHEYAPPEPIEGNNVDITVRIGNDGYIDVVDQHLEFHVDGVVVSTREVSVNVSETVTEHFSIQTTGSHDILFTMGEEELRFFMKVASNNDPYANPGLENDDGNPVEKPRAGKEYTFSPNAGDNDGDPMTYFWDFGDGVTSYEENPTHKYAEDGDYTVTLTVTDSHGAAVTKTFEVQVDKAQPKEEPGFGAVVAFSALIVALLAAAMLRRRT
jgi:hypothetical protein